jgi:hypothetical protein
MTTKPLNDHIDAFVKLAGKTPDDRTFSDLYELALQNATLDYEFQKRVGKKPRTTECMRLATIQALKLAYAMGSQNAMNSNNSGRTVN